MTKLAPEWVRPSDPVIRSPARSISFRPPSSTCLILMTPNIPPPPPLATHSTVHLQYEDTQTKGRLNNHGQARGGDTEGTASSYQRPDKSTDHDLAPMSAPPPPQDFSIFNVPPSKLNPYQQLVMLTMPDNIQVTHPRHLTDRSLSRNTTQDIMMSKVARVMMLTRDDPHITTSSHNTMTMRGIFTNHSLGPITVRFRAMMQIQETAIKDQLPRMVVVCLLCSTLTIPPGARQYSVARA